MFNFDYSNLFIDSLKQNKTTRVISTSEQAGKSFLTKAWSDIVNRKIKNSNYIKKFYLHSGTFTFKFNYYTKKCELIKKEVKWKATNFDYIIKFLYHEGAKLKNIVTIEKEMFERT